MEEILVETKFGRFGGFSLNCQPPSPKLSLMKKCHLLNYIPLPTKIFSLKVEGNKEKKIIHNTSL